MIERNQVPDAKIEAYEREHGYEAPRVTGRQPMTTWTGTPTYPDCQNPRCDFAGACQPLEVATVEQAPGYQIPVMIYRCGWLEGEVNG